MELLSVEVKKVQRGAYFRKLKEELKLVVWPSRKELKSGAKAVVFSTFFCGMGIYLVDVVVKYFLDSFAVLFRWVFG